MTHSPPARIAHRLQYGVVDMYLVFGNDERMNEARKLLAVEKTRDTVCVFQPNVKVIKEDVKKIPWGARAYAFDFDDEARRILKDKCVTMIRYGENEEFKKENSVLTAESVLIILLTKSKSKITDKRVLVIGNGASGKEIVKMLVALNVEVAVMTARSESVTKGATAMTYGDEIGDFDFIVNTAPSRIIDEARLKKLKADVEIIDIASPPYGFDKDIMAELSIKYGVYPALPVKYKSESAGKIIAKIVTEGDYD